METTIDLGRELGIAALSLVRDRVRDLNDGDLLTIIMESADAHQADGIFRLLDEYKPKMDYAMKTDDTGHYYIYARYGGKDKKHDHFQDTFAQNRIK